MRSPQEKLMNDALAEVFSRVPFPDRLITLPLICKRWRDVSRDSACWREVDMQPWFEERAEQDFSWGFECEPKMEFLIKKIADLSDGQLTELRAMNCTDAAIVYMAERSPLLKVLCIPDSALVTDESGEVLAALCSKLEQLDLSDCYNMSSVSFEALGRNCKSLVRLARNMIHHNSYVQTSEADDEAMAMSKHMLNLKHLEMKRASISNVGARNLARGCRQLEKLNLSACTALTPRFLRISSNCAPISGNLSNRSFHVCTLV